MRSALLISLCLAVLGCAANPERIHAQSDLEVCRSYGVYSKSPLFSSNAASYKQELINRNLITQSEWDLVSRRRIQTGMSQCAMYASWGEPDRENRTVGAWGVHIQHVYNLGYRYIRPSYVYTKNGTVDAWQD